MASRELSGVVLISKPAGKTSFDCVRALKKAWNCPDVGHGGTLDTFATGLLPILVGEGLKLVRFFLENYPTLPTYWKSYDAIVHSGVQTDTGDPSGEQIKIEEVRSQNITAPQVTEAMTKFVQGPYIQLPPQYSAKKVSGERASDRARLGEETRLKPVAVSIRQLELCPPQESPFWPIRVTCSKGTYIRVLAEDLFESVGSCAHLAKLHRTGVGPFQVQNAISLESALQSDPLEHLISLDDATRILPAITTPSQEQRELHFGRGRPYLAKLVEQYAPGPYCLRAESTDKAIALIEILPSASEAKFLRGFTELSKGMTSL